MANCLPSYILCLKNIYFILKKLKSGGTILYPPPTHTRTHTLHPSSYTQSYAVKTFRPLHIAIPNRIISLRDGKPDSNRQPRFLMGRIKDNCWHRRLCLLFCLSSSICQRLVIIAGTIGWMQWRQGRRIRDFAGAQAPPEHASAPLTAKSTPSK